MRKRSKKDTNVSESLKVFFCSQEGKCRTKQLLQPRLPVPALKFEWTDLIYLVVLLLTVAVLTIAAFAYCYSIEKKNQHNNRQFKSRVRWESHKQEQQQTEDVLHSEENASENKDEEYKNPVVHASVRNEQQLNLLMKKLADLHETTEHKEKNNTREHCSHMHAECWEGKFMCSGCYQEVTDPDRVHSENEIMNRLGAEDPSEPEEAVNRGLTIAFLVAFCRTFNLYEVTTGEVLRNIVVPFTSGTRCRFVELEAMQESGVVGEAKTFISHCNKAPFGALVAALCDGGADLTRRVWVDIFAVRQWPSSKHDLHFEMVIRQCSSFMVVCPSLTEVIAMGYEDMMSRQFSAAAKAKVPFFRIWCLYELYYAAMECKPIIMKGGSYRLEGPEGQRVMRFEADQDMLKKMYYAIDVNDAEATVPSDKAMIFSKIHSYEEEVAGFNRRVRGVLAGAEEACKYPDLLCAVCGDAAAMAVVRGQPEKFFISAAAGGYLAVLEDLLLQYPNLIHTATQDGWTALMLAAYGGHLACLQLLVDRGATINAADQDGWTAIMAAAYGGHLSCLQLLVGRGAEVNLADQNGWTALIGAAYGGHITCLQWLVENGAEVDAVAQDDGTAIMRAAEGGHLTCLQYLVDRGADVKVVAQDGWTAIMLATEGGHLTCLQMLIDRGADVNAVAQKGVTAIMRAAMGGRLTCLQLLVGRGADLNAEDDDGGTAYQYAARSGHQDCMDYLILKGAAVP